MAQKLTFQFDLKKYPEAGSESYRAEGNEPIGSGAYAEVWAVRSADQRLLRAVKVTALGYQAKLEDEYLRLEKLKRLDEDGLIVQVYGLGKTSDGRPCMLMELVTGQPLWKLGQEVRGIAPGPIIDRLAEYETLRVRVTTQITKVLYTAYKARIALVDLKMDNFYFDPSWPQLIKVVDWNLVYSSDTPSELSNVFVKETLPKIGRMVYEIFTGLDIETPEQIGELRPDQTWAMLWDMLTFQTRALLRDMLVGQVTQENPALELWSSWTAQRRLMVEREGLDILRGLERADLEQRQDTEVRSDKLLQAYSVLNLIEPGELRVSRLREAWHGWIGSLVYRKDFSRALLELRTARRLYPNSLRLDFWYLFSLLGKYAPTPSAYLENIQNQQALLDKYWGEGEFRKLSNLLARVRERAEEIWYPELKTPETTAVISEIRQIIERIETILRLYTLLLEQEEKIRTKSADVIAISNQIEAMLAAMPWLDAYLDDVVPFRPTLRELWKRQALYRDIYTYGLAIDGSLPELIRRYDDLVKQPHLDPNLTQELNSDLEKLRAFDAISYHEINPIVAGLESETKDWRQKTSGPAENLRQFRLEALRLQRANEDVQEQLNLLETRLSGQLSALKETNQDAQDQTTTLVDSIAGLRETTSQVKQESRKLNAELENQKGDATDLENKAKDLKQREVALRKLIEELEQKLAELDELADILDRGFGKLESQREVLSQRAEQLRAEFAALYRILTELKKQQKELDQQFTELDQQRRRMEQLHQELESVFAKLKAAVPVLYQLALEIDRVLDDLYKRGQLLGSKLSGLQIDFRSIDGQHRETSNQAKDLQGLVEQLDQLKTSLQRQVTTIDETFANMERTAGTLQARSGKLKSDLAKLEGDGTFEEDLKRLNARLTEIEKQFPVLEERVLDAGEKTNALSSQQDTNEKFVRSLHDSFLKIGETISEIRQSAQRQQNHANFLRRQLPQVKRWVSFLSQQTRHLENESQAAKRRVENVTSLHDGLVPQAENLQTLIEALRSKTARLEQEQVNVTENIDSLEVQNRALLRRQRRERRILALAGRNNDQLKALLASNPPDPEFDSLLVQIANKLPLEGIENTILEKVKKKIRTEQIIFLIATVIIGLLLVGLLVGGIFLIGKLVPGPAPDNHTTNMTLTAAFALSMTLTATPTPTPSVEPSLTLSPTGTPTITLTPTPDHSIKVQKGTQLTLDENSTLFVKDPTNTNVEIMPNQEIVAIGIYKAKNLTLVKALNGYLGWVKSAIVEQMPDKLPEVVACYSFVAFQVYNTLPANGTPLASDLKGYPRIVYQVIATDANQPPKYLWIKLDDKYEGWVSANLDGCVGDFSKLPIRNP